ncbi:hypothetical protein BGY98DRAFT_936809 [Russula aff. rugulosa BPL654]|nr:hypothetical protein BGY98DRAFT_936809 [Russula aff. rugulosa BPL654]
MNTYLESGGMGTLVNLDGCDLLDGAIHECEAGIREVDRLEFGQSLLVVFCLEILEDGSKSCTGKKREGGVCLSGAVDKRGKNNTGQAKMLWRSAFKRSVGKAYSIVPEYRGTVAASPVAVQATRPLQSSNSFSLMSLLLRQSQLLGLQTFQNLPILKLRSVSMGDKGTECPDDDFPQRHSEVPTGDASDLPPLKTLRFPSGFDATKPHVALGESGPIGVRCGWDVSLGGLAVIGFPGSALANAGGWSGVTGSWK